MTENHPITPPPELVQEWLREEYERGLSAGHVATQAARWGADQELEACCEWLGEAPVVYNDNGDLHPGSYLRDARRPKPPSLKEQALQELERIVTLLMPVTGPNKVERFAIIRRALEQLDD